MPRRLVQRSSELTVIANFTKQPLARRRERGANTPHSLRGGVIFTQLIHRSIMSITIDLNDALVQQAEQYARQHGQSLTALVENYLRQVVQEPAQSLAPAVQELYGILSLPADFDYKTQRDEPAR